MEIVAAKRGLNENLTRFICTKFFSIGHNDFLGSIQFDAIETTYTFDCIAFISIDFPHISVHFLLSICFDAIQNTPQTLLLMGKSIAFVKYYTVKPC